MEEKICLRVCGDFFTGLFILRGIFGIAILGNGSAIVPVNGPVLDLLDLLPDLDEGVAEP